MKHYSVKPLSIVLRRSHRLAGLLGVACGSGVALSLFMPVPLWARLGVVSLLLAATGHAWLQHVALRLPSAVDGLEISLHGQLRCRMRRHGWQDAQVLGSSCVTPWLTVLHLRLTGRAFLTYVVLLPDMLDAEAFRALRVWLRWGQPETLAHG